MCGSLCRRLASVLYCNPNALAPTRYSLIAAGTSSVPDFLMMSLALNAEAITQTDVARRTSHHNVVGAILNYPVVGVGIPVG